MNDSKLRVTPQTPGGPVAPEADAPKLPHERDQSLGATAKRPDDRIRQAKADLDAGLVDTDMHATPGQDAQRRDTMVKRGR